MAKKRRKKPLLSRLEKKADRALSLYVRDRTRREFNELCPLCGTGKIQACFHFVRRKRKAVRWDDRNVVGSCHRCNYLEYRFPDDSRAWYIRHYGVDAYLSVVDASTKPFTSTVEFLESVIRKYTNLLASLEAIRGTTPQA